jgi:hypothetical protein
VTRHAKIGRPIAFGAQRAPQPLGLSADAVPGLAGDGMAVRGVPSVDRSLVQDVLERDDLNPAGQGVQVLDAVIVGRAEAAP